MSEEQGQAHDEHKKVQRAEHQPAQPQADLEGQLVPESAPSYSGSLLGDARLNARGNQPVKVAVTRQAQQTYGNRAVQRVLQRVPVQRDGPTLTMPRLGSSLRRPGRRPSLFAPGERPQLRLDPDLQRQMIQSLLQMRGITSIRPAMRLSPFRPPPGADPRITSPSTSTGSPGSSGPSTSGEEEGFITWSTDFNLEAPEVGGDRQPPGPSPMETEQERAETIQAILISGAEAEGTPLGTQLLNVGLPLLTAALAGTPRARQLQERLQRVNIQSIGITFNPVEGNYGASVTFRIPSL